MALKFSSEINLGNVTAIAVLLVAGLSAFSKVETRVAVAEAAIVDFDADREADRRHRERIEDKIDRLIERPD